MSCTVEREDRKPVDLHSLVVYLATRLGQPVAAEFINGNKTSARAYVHALPVDVKIELRSRGYNFFREKF